MRKRLEDEKGVARGRAHCGEAAGVRSGDMWLQPKALKILWRLSPFVRE